MEGLGGSTACSHFQLGRGATMQNGGLENSGAKVATGCWGLGGLSPAPASFYIFPFPFLSFRDADMAGILCRDRRQKSTRKSRPVSFQAQGISGLISSERG